MDCHAFSFLPMKCAKARGVRCLVTFIDPSSKRLQNWQKALNFSSLNVIVMLAICFLKMAE